MKYTLTLITTILTLTVFGQSAQEHLQNGINKHTQKDYKGAIKEYDIAIKINKDYTEAYYNRGNCELALKEFKAAMADYNTSIQINPKFVKAYYSRASIYVIQQKYAEALPDLDKAIELDPSLPNVLTLRGQIRAQTGNKNGACEDFTKAKEIGDQQADKYIAQFCGNPQQAGESLMLHWPESENWKVGNSSENEKTAILELIHSNETLEKWTEFGYMMSIKGLKNIPMDEAMNLLFDQAKLKSPKAKLTFIEKNETVEHPWTIFTIEAPNFINDKTPESQLWYVVQGKSSLYTNFRAVKQATVPSDLKEKWTKFFKTGKIVYK